MVTVLQNARRSGFRLVLAGLLALLCPVTALAIELSLEIDPSQGTLQDSFYFSVIVRDGSNAERPQLEGGDDFDMTFIGPQTSMTIVNGSVSSEARYNYRLVPKRQGTLTTPAATIESDGAVITAQALTVSVSQAAPEQPQEADAPVRLSQSVEKSRIFVGEQLPYQLDLITRVSILEFQFPDLSFDGFWSERLAENERGRRMIGGMPHTVLRNRRALFPLVPGKAHLPARELTIKVRERMGRGGNSLFDMDDPFGNEVFEEFFGGRVAERTLRSNALDIEVIPLPAPQPDIPLWGLPSAIVGKTEISVKPGTDELKVGESRTITVTVTSLGNLNPLKEVPLDLPASVRRYDESPQSTYRESSGKLISKRVFRISLVPTAPGTLTIPPIELGFFDTDSGHYQRTRSEGFSYNVSGTAIAQVDEYAETAPADATPTPVPAPAYYELGVFDRTVALISPALFLLVLLGAVIAAGVSWILLRARAGSRAEKRHLHALLTAGTLENIDTNFRAFLGQRWKCQSSEYEDLKAITRQRVPQQGTCFAIQNLLDEFEFLRYGGTQIDQAMLEDLRRRAVESARQLLKEGNCYHSASV